MKNIRAGERLLQAPGPDVVRNDATNGLRITLSPAGAGTSTGKQVPGTASVPRECLFDLESRGSTAHRGRLGLRPKKELSAPPLFLIIGVCSVSEDAAKVAALDCDYFDGVHLREAAPRFRDRPIFRDRRGFPSSPRFSVIIALFAKGKARAHTYWKNAFRMLPGRSGPVNGESRIVRIEGDWNFQFQI